MVFSELSQLASGFEGCEKKLQIRFVGADLRRISRDKIVEVLTAARCTILQTCSTDWFDAYVLSESSLFVYPHQVILKTCGTTALLHCMPVLLTHAAEIGAKPIHVQFSRSNFMFPHLQPFPHRNFSTEVHYLNTLFTGSAYILGAINGPRWHVYFSDVLPRDQLPEEAFLPTAQTHRLARQRLLTGPAEQDEVKAEAEAEAEADVVKSEDKEKEKALMGPTLEIVMFNLDPEAMAIYYKTDEIQTGDQCTKLAGIDQLIPGSEVDAFLFEPCGYSCNGLRDDVYFTIHITPEPECSFVSFETNLVLSDYTDLVQHVLRVFRPGSFSLSLMADDNCPMFEHTRQGLQWRLPEFEMHQLTSHSFSGGYNITAGQYVSQRQLEEMRRLQEQAIALAPQAVVAAPAPDSQLPVIVMESKDGLTAAASVVVASSVQAPSPTHAVVADSLTLNLGADSAVGEPVADQESPLFGVAATKEFLKRMRDSIPAVADALANSPSHSSQSTHKLLAADLVNNDSPSDADTLQESVQALQTPAVAAAAAAASCNCDETTPAASAEEVLSEIAAEVALDRQRSQRGEGFLETPHSLINSDLCDLQRALAEAGTEAAEVSQEVQAVEACCPVTASSQKVPVSFLGPKAPRDNSNNNISVSGIKNSSSSSLDPVTRPAVALSSATASAVHQRAVAVAAAASADSPVAKRLSDDEDYQTLGGTSEQTQSDDDFSSSGDVRDRRALCDSNSDTPEHVHTSRMSDGDSSCGGDSSHHLHHHHHCANKLLQERSQPLTVAEARELDLATLQRIACRVVGQTCYEACVPHVTAPGGLTSDERRQLLSKIIQEDDGDGEAFFLVDVPELVARYADFLGSLPRVEPLYNVKCNSDAGVIRALHQLGCGFQGSSASSLRMLVDEFSVDPVSSLAFVNPWKPLKQIQTARELGVALMAFDHDSELDKLARLYPEAGLVLQIDPYSGDMAKLVAQARAAVSKAEQQKQEGGLQQSSSLDTASLSASGSSVAGPPRLPAGKKKRNGVGQLSGSASGSGPGGMSHNNSNSRAASGTHGASLDTVHSLLSRVVELNLNLVGVSIKMSAKRRCCESRYLCRGIKAAKAVFDLARARFGLEPRLLDLGDTFPSHTGFCSRKKTVRRSRAGGLRGHRTSSSAGSSSDILSVSANNSTVAPGCSFGEMSRQVNQTLDAVFPAKQFPSLSIVADPARFVVTSSHTLAVSVIGKREVSLDQLTASAALSPLEDGSESGYLSSGSCYSVESDSAASLASSSSSSSTYEEDIVAPSAPVSGASAGTNLVGCQYYINDGLYGSFNCLLYDKNHTNLRPQPLALPANLNPEDEDRDPGVLRSTLFGPTCDGLDCVMEEVELPELNLGDWLYFDNMGAHTTAAGTNFNGFVLPQSRYVVCALD